MPTPMKFDDAVRLCGTPQNVGSPVGIRERLLGRFVVIQGARDGSFADRERAYLVGEGSKAGDGRAELWATHLGVSRPFTDGMKSTASMPAVVAQGWVQARNDLYVLKVEGGCSAVKA